MAPKSFDRYLRTFAKLPFPIPLGKITELRAARQSVKSQVQTIAKLNTELAHPPLITRVAHGMTMDQAIVDYVSPEQPCNFLTRKLGTFVSACTINQI